MRLVHHDVEHEFEDEWWRDAGMNLFDPRGPHFAIDLDECSPADVFLVAVSDVAPLHRNLGPHGVFRSRNRVVSILKAFASGTPLPPIAVTTRDVPSAASIPPSRRSAPVLLLDRGRLRIRARAAAPVRVFRPRRDRMSGGLRNRGGRRTEAARTGRTPIP